MNWVVALIFVIVIVAVALVLKFVLGITFTLMWVILLGLLGGFAVAIICGLYENFIGKNMNIWAVWSISTIICAAIAAFWIYF